MNKDNADKYILFHTTSDGVKIFVSRGRKSPYDFRVHYREGNKRKRTPKHIHLAVDLLIKYYFEKDLTLKLRDHLHKIFLTLKPVNNFPPKLQIFNNSHLRVFEKLNNFGEYSIEFILIVSELIMIQEITNRSYTLKSEPTKEERKDLLAYRMYDNIDKDIYSVISSATFKGPGAIT